MRHYIRVLNCDEHFRLVCDPRHHVCCVRDRSIVVRSQFIDQQRCVTQSFLIHRR